jgi:putative DNA primase/helicase
MRFLSETFPDDPDTLESFHRWCGYSMIGLVREEIVCFFLGKGSNGKSTINRVFAHIFGDYRAQVPAGLLLAGAKDDPKAPNPALAMTIGARMLAVNEVPKHARLDDHAVRQVGGTEPITTRNLHERPFTFLPSGKLTVSLNDMPRASDMGQGLWRRVRIIPFVTHIPDTKQNHNLVHELIAESPGILNWQIEGCRKWFEEGLVWSSACTEAAALYQKDTDTLGEFMTRYEVTGNDADRIKQGDVWREYSLTVVPMGETRVGKKLFYQMVGERHGIGRKHSGGNDWFTGIREV